VQPLAIDLFCGLGGWTEGLLAEGYRVVGFDLERHDYGDGERYPAQLVLQDVLTLHGRQFRDAALIVASPPCQAYSYRAMPWKRAKALPPPDNTLFEACFRIQREANEAVRHHCQTCGVFMLSHHEWTNKGACKRFTPGTRHIPMVVENVCGAQKWVGRAKWHFGSFYLWGDVPALMPMAKTRAKVPGFRSGRSFQSESVKVGERLREAGIKNTGGSWFNVAHNTTSGKGNDPRDAGMKQHGSGAAGFDAGLCRNGSKSSARKRASAHIAKIPLALSRHIARAWWPVV